MLFSVQPLLPDRDQQPQRHRELKDEETTDVS